MKWPLVLAPLLCVHAKNLQQTFVREPESVTAREGEAVTLACSVAHKVGVLQWTKDDFGLGTARSLPGYSRLSMVGGAEDGEDSGQWNLRLEDVRLEDDGRYQCQVGATDTAPPLRSRYARLTVLTAPEPPVLTAGPRLRLEEGRLGLVQCISRGGHPASVIRWRLNGQLVSSGIQENVTNMKDSKKTITVSTLKFPATTNLSGAELVCEAENAAAAEAGIVRTLVEVEYKPRVALQTDKGEYAEGDRVTVVCSVDALPQQVTYQWFVGGQEIPAAAGAVEMVLEATRELHDKPVSCLARNTVGQASAELRLDVKYAPRLLEEAGVQEVTGHEGDRVILQCQVDSNPEPEYTWIKNGDIFEMVGTGPVLSFTLTPGTQGGYTCQASVAGYTPVRKHTQVTLLGPPVILAASEAAQYGAVGDTVRVVCESRSAPDIRSIGWRFRGEELRQQSPELSIVEARRGDIVSSTLVISSAQPHHFGDYSCAVENELGRAEAVIRLRQSEPLPLLIILAATISGLLLSVVLLVIAMTCVKTASKKHRSAAAAAPATAADISAWPRGRSCGYSDTSDSSDEPSSSNITSSLTVDDPDDSFESLPVNYSAFIKSENIPDVKSVYKDSSDAVIKDKDSTLLTRDATRQSCNYIVYNPYTSAGGEHTARPSSCYANPYVQSTSPMTVERAAAPSPFYTNTTPYKDRDSAVIRYLEGEVTAQQLDDIKLGTHV